MQLLELMEEALCLVKTTPKHGTTYFEILRARYFDAYCTSNEEAYLSLILLFLKAVCCHPFTTNAPEPTKHLAEVNAPMHFLRLADIV